MTRACMPWLVKCGRRGCCALAVRDAALWIDSPPVEFSCLNPIHMCVKLAVLYGGAVNMCQPIAGRFFVVCGRRPLQAFNFPYVHRLGFFAS